MRSLAREAVFKYLFSRLFNPSDEELFAVLHKSEGITDNDRNFINDIYSHIKANREDYLSRIEKLSLSFKINRIYNADKCALLLGFGELDAFPDTPIPVVIDETVNLVSKYSSEKSTDFVNGILAQYIKEKTKND